MRVILIRIIIDRSNHNRKIDQNHSLLASLSKTSDFINQEQPLVATPPPGLIVEWGELRKVSGDLSYSDVSRTPVPRIIRTGIPTEVGHLFQMPGMAGQNGPIDSFKEQSDAGENPKRGEPRFILNRAKNIMARKPIAMVFEVSISRTYRHPL